MISAAFFLVLGVGLSPLVENFPGVSQVQAFVRKGVAYVRSFFSGYDSAE